MLKTDQIINLLKVERLIKFCHRESDFVANYFKYQTKMAAMVLSHGKIHEKYL